MAGDEEVGGALEVSESVGGLTEQPQVVGVAGQTAARVVESFGHLVGQQDGLGGGQGCDMPGIVSGVGQRGERGDDPFPVLGPAVLAPAALSRVEEQGERGLRGVGVDRGAYFGDVARQPVDGGLLQQAGPQTQGGRKGSRGGGGEEVRDQAGTSQFGGELGRLDQDSSSFLGTSGEFGGALQHAYGLE